MNPSNHEQGQTNVWKEQKTVFALSFCDPDKPTGHQHLGTAVVYGATISEALTNSWKTGVNPGGEVRFYGPIPVELVPPEQPINKLLTAEDMMAIGGDMAPSVDVPE